MKKYKLIIILFCVFFLPCFLAIAENEEKRLIIEPHGSSHVEGYWAFTTHGKQSLIESLFNIKPKDQHHSNNISFNTEWVNEVELAHNENTSLPINTTILKSFSYHAETAEFLGLMYGAIMTPDNNSFICEQSVQHRITQSHQLTYKINWAHKPDYIQVVLFGNNQEISDIHGKRLTGNTTKDEFSVQFKEAPYFSSLIDLGRGHRPAHEINPAASLFSEIDHEKVDISYDTVFSRLINLLEKPLDNNMTYISTFQTDALDISFSAHKNPKRFGQNSNWTFYYGIAGLLIRPIFIEQQTENCDLRSTSDPISRLEDTRDFSSILKNTSCALKLLKEGDLKPDASFELRNILVKKLKNNDTPHLKELYAQLIRKVNQYQKQNIVPAIGQELNTIHAELEMKRNLIERLVHHLVTIKEGRLEQSEVAIKTVQSEI